MAVFITSQKKLALVVGVTPESISLIKTGKHGISPELAERLEQATGIKQTVWASAGKKKKRLHAALKRFLKEEVEKEKAALTKANVMELRGDA